MILISRILLLRILQVRILILMYWILLLRKLQVKNLWINFHSIIGNNEDISAIGSCLKIKFEDIGNIDIDIENIDIEDIVDQLKIQSN